jgi:hypothetical protein
MPRRFREANGKEPLTERLELDLADAAPSGALEPEIESSDPGEEADEGGHVTRAARRVPGPPPPAARPSWQRAPEPDVEGRVHQHEQHSARPFDNSLYK